MKYITKITNRVTVKQDFENLLDNSIADIKLGKMQRELLQDPILKCKATAQRISDCSAVMTVFLYSNENPVEELEQNFKIDSCYEQTISKKFSAFVLEWTVEEDGKIVFEACNSLENGIFNSCCKRY